MALDPSVVQQHLTSLLAQRSLDAALAFFDALDYQYADELPLPTRTWPEGAKDVVRSNAEPPIYLAGHRDFHVIYTHLKTDDLARTVERPVVEQTLHKLHPYALFVFANRDRSTWDFANVKYVAEEDPETGVEGRYEADPAGTDFYTDFLLPLFVALSNQGLALPRLGDVPFLNGGLFEAAADAPLADQLVLSNAAFKTTFDELLECYNFTVREDTPLDVEVAIDPEMLGQVFENLVLGLERGEDRRKATGSFYTARVIVHFMCRQALKEYLAAESGLDAGDIEALMQIGPAEQLTPEEVAHLQMTITEPQARLLRGLIETLRALDPAVGSGAFLLGMLYEMVALTKLLDVRLYGQARVRRRNYDYDLKRGSIERNLYGVDIQPEAVRICELRLWLSLMVEYERKPGEGVPPLPNLSYRVRVGDSLIERLLGEPVQLDELADDALAEFPICSWLSRQHRPKVAYNEHPDWDEFLVVWYDSPLTDLPSTVSGRRIYADGTGFPGGGFTIAEHATEDRVAPDVAYNLARNEYLVTYHSWDDVYATRLEANGDPLGGGEFSIATWPDWESTPAIAACHTADQYFVTWASDAGSNWDIYGRFVSGEGAVDDVLHISDSAHYEGLPDVACNPRGHQYLVVWEQWLWPADLGVWGRMVHADKTQDDQFRIVSPYNGYRRYAPAVTAGSPEYLVAWSHEREGTSYVDIHGRLVWPGLVYVPLLHRNN